MRAAVFVTCLLLLHVQGHPGGRSSHCMCLNEPLKWIPLKMIREPLLKHDPSSYCPQTEYLVTIRDNKQKCVSEKFWTFLQQTIQRRQSRNQTVKPTSFSFTKSTSVHTTPKL